MVHVGVGLWTRADNVQQQPGPPAILPHPASRAGSYRRKSLQCLEKFTSLAAAAAAGRLPSVYSFISSNLKPAGCSGGGLSLAGESWPIMIF